jgi:hypothetical protein
VVAAQPVFFNVGNAVCLDAYTPAPGQCGYQIPDSDFTSFYGARWSLSSPLRLGWHPSSSCSGDGCDADLIWSRAGGCTGTRASRGLQNRTQVLELKGAKTICRAVLIYVARGGRLVRCPRTGPQMIELCRCGVPAASEGGRSRSARRPFVQQLRRQTVIRGGTQWHSANSDRYF